MKISQDVMLQCPVCAGRVRKTIETQQFAYRDGPRDILLATELPVYTCNDCGEQFLAHDGEAVQHEAVCRYLGRLTPQDIVSLRKSKRMTQQDLAEATGIGVASIKRWESGNLIQSVAMDKALRAVKDTERVNRQAPFQPVFRTKFLPRSLEGAKLFELRLPS